MKRILCSGIIIGIVFGFLGGIYAATLQSDYKALERDRKKLEKQRKYYEEQIAALSSQANDLRHQITECASKPDGWEDRLGIRQSAEKLETQRAAIAEMRSNLDKKRLGIEQARIGIEKKYSDKSTGSEYEQEFRQYMENLHNDYIVPVETQLLQRYEKYLSGFENYIPLLKNTLQLCKEKKTE